MQHTTPITHDILLIGGGHSHLAVLMRFAMKPVPGVRLTLVSREAMTPYSGMLPGLLAGEYTFDEAHIDLRPLAQFANARFYHGAVERLDLNEKRAIVAGRPDISFDLVSIDVGSRPKTKEIDGAELFGLPVKPIDLFLDRWRELEGTLADCNPCRLVMVGGGAGGVEAGLGLARRLRNIGTRQVDLTIISAKESPLDTLSPPVQMQMVDALKSRHVSFVGGVRARALKQGQTILDDGRVIDSDVIVLATGARAPEWLADTSLALDTDGFIAVNKNLQSTSHDFVFAAGDCAAFVDHPLPKSGVYAVRQGPALAENLRRTVKKQSLKPFRPQNRTLALITTGERHAVVAYDKLTAAGKWAWHWKDWIDRRWMRKYQVLPQMDVDPEAMRCGGCGAKIANDVLRLALHDVPSAQHPDVLVGVDGADDASVIRQSDGRLLVQSVDFFRPFIDDPYTFAKIATNHCLNDVYAMGITPHSALAQIAVPFGSAKKVGDELRQVMAGATDVLTEAGVDLLGGHSAEGAELTFGLTVNGFGEEPGLMTKSGLKPGDALIINKAIGTGVIFAADMQAKVSTEVVETAVQTMALSNAKASEILREFGVQACTDITGFGLLGHILEMLDASDGLGLTLNLQDVPILKGARELVAKGHASSLYPANLTFAERVAEPVPREDHRFPLLLDPQTAGGLVAGINAEKAADLCAALKDAGYADAACIGYVGAGGVINVE